MSEIRVDNITDEAGTGAPGFSQGLPADALTGNVAADRITDALNATGSAPIYACRAWVNFNASNENIRNSGNVSSITDLGTGEKIINFSTNMPFTGYSVTACAEGQATASAYVSLERNNQPLETNGFGIRISDGFGNLTRQNPTTVTISVFA